MNKYKLPRVVRTQIHRRCWRKLAGVKTKAPRQRSRKHQPFSQRMNEYRQRQADRRLRWRLEGVMGKARLLRALWRMRKG